MKNAIYSKIDMNDLENNLVVEYRDCINSLYSHEKIKQLNEFSQHCGTSRLQHSINVSYYSFLICRKLNLDYKSAARAGLLHDLFLYDWRTNKQPEGAHAVAHPIVALRTAKTITTLNEIEEDAIVNHMWPISNTPPKYKESYVVNLVDTFLAIFEMFHGLSSNFKRQKTQPEALNLNIK